MRPVALKRSLSPHTLAKPPRTRVKIDKPQTAKPAGKSQRMVLDNLEITWLGTSAGCPSKTRNVSSSALRLDGEVGDRRQQWLRDKLTWSKLWLVDVGEATQHQIQRSKLKVSSATKIFLTHMHGDHTFGLVPLLCALADGAGGMEGADPREKEAARFPPIDIYGLTGTRRLVRTVLECTYTRLARRYRVHELLFDKDETFGGRRHHNELPGQDIRIQDDGCWKNFMGSEEKMQVSAVPIRHTVPCVGFIFAEPPRPGAIDPSKYVPHIERNKEALMKEPWNMKTPMKLLAKLKETSEPITLPDGTVLEPPPMGGDGRKLVILGDTYYAESEAMDRLGRNADLVVHEATNAYLPGLDEAVKPDDTYESLRIRSKSHGHSTPQVAGQFAKRIGAKNLFMNHFSARYIDAGTTLKPDETGKVELNEEITVLEVGGNHQAEGVSDVKVDSDSRIACMKMIEDQATEAWDSGRRAVATRDFMHIVVKRRR